MAISTAMPNLEVGPMGVVAIGYDWGSLRTEAELGLRTNDLGYITGDVNARVLGIPVLNENVDSDDLSQLGLDLRGHQRILGVMANALIDFDLGPVTIWTAERTMFYKCSQPERWRTTMSATRRTFSTARPAAAESPR